MALLLLLLLCVNIFGYIARYVRTVLALGHRISDDEGDHFPSA